MDAKEKMATHKSDSEFQAISVQTVLDGTKNNTSRTVITTAL